MQAADQEGSRDNDLECELFSRPLAPILAMPASAPTKNRRMTQHFDLSKVRRRSRLALKWWIGTMMQWAQETLGRKMGTLLQGQSLTDEDLKDYLAMYGPLPQDVIVALSRLFKLDYQLTT